MIEPGIGRFIGKENFSGLIKMVKVTLPLLDCINNLFEDTRFDNCLLIASQHILETNFTMFQYFFKKGLNHQILSL